jgi:hypothetical protein
MAGRGDCAVTEPENIPPGCAAFESLLEALKWRVVRREKDRVIIERMGEQAEVKAEENEG